MPGLAEIQHRRPAVAPLHRGGADLAAKWNCSGGWRLVCAFALLMLAGSVPAQEQALEAPPLPPPVQPGEPFEPQVTIRRTEREMIYEYRQNGVLFLVRVQPMFGPPYYFVDIDGDGRLDFRPGDPVHDRVQQWTLWRW